jgi:hypothetical protein
VTDDRAGTLKRAGDDADTSFEPVPLQEPVKPCANCSCCVTSVRIENIQKVITADEAGHTFDLVVEMTFKAGPSSPTCDCTLQWFETRDRDDPKDNAIKAGVKVDMWKLHPESSTFMRWKMRRAPCPNGGNQTVTITDTPSMSRQHSRRASRTVDFELTVLSCGSCPCGRSSATAKAVQVIVISAGDVKTCTFDLKP